MALVGTVNVLQKNKHVHFCSEEISLQALCILAQPRYNSLTCATFGY